MDDEIEQDETLNIIDGIEEDFAYWQELADLLGWKVIGFTFKVSALYETGKEYNNTISLWGKQRDDIVRAIRNGQ